MAEGRKAILICTVLEEEISSILMYLLILRSQCNISLKIEEGLVRVAFYL